MVKFDYRENIIVACEDEYSIRDVVNIITDKVSLVKPSITDKVSLVKPSITDKVNLVKPSITFDTTKSNGQLKKTVSTQKLHTFLHYISSQYQRRLTPLDEGIQKVITHLQSKNY